MFIAGNTPLHYAACGGYEDVVRVLIESGANVEEHNENGHTPLMEAASAGHVGVARILLEAGACINTHSNEFKESALTLACYKGKLDSLNAKNSCTGFRCYGTAIFHKNGTNVRPIGPFGTQLFHSCH